MPPKTSNTETKKQVVHGLADFMWGEIYHVAAAVLLSNAFREPEQNITFNEKEFTFRGSSILLKGPTRGTATLDQAKADDQAFLNSLSPADREAAKAGTATALNPEDVDQELNSASTPAERRLFQKCDFARNHTLMNQNQIIFLRNVLGDELRALPKNVQTVSLGSCTDDFITPTFAWLAAQATDRRAEAFRLISEKFIHSRVQDNAPGLRNYLSNRILGVPKYPKGDPRTATAKAIIWVRTQVGENSWRNTTLLALTQLAAAIRGAGIKEVVLCGDRTLTIDLSEIHPSRVYDLRLFYKDPQYSRILRPEGNEPDEDREDTYANQLLVIWLLKRYFGVRCIVGFLSGALDGPAFMGIPTIFLQDSRKTTRMPAAARVIPSLGHVPIDAENYATNSALHDPAEITLVTQTITNTINRVGALR